jgi:VIT1/CCC1 family predicted Fe2+/Mn2+ transporter
MDKDNLRRFRENFIDERNGAALYRIMADAEPNSQIAELYRRLAMVEDRHAEAWADRLHAAGGPLPSVRLSWRTRVLRLLVQRFGVSAVLPTIATLEEVDSHAYSLQSDATRLVPDERSHARLLRQISQSASHGVSGSALAQIEGRHRAGGGNALRAAVLGASDGLLSNLGLVMGVAGAELNSHSILITGMAGLLAGASSMALGEWLSVQSSRELYEHQLAIEQGEIATAPEEEAEELALIYQARGLDATRARQLADQIMNDRTSALDTLAREELGIDPAELGGSAWQAATASFITFALGAVVPVFPFFVVTGQLAIAASLVCAAVGLFVIGGAITLFTGRPVLASGCRQVVFGLTAAAITYGIGRLIGVRLTS